MAVPRRSLAPTPQLRRAEVAAGVSLEYEGVVRLPREGAGCGPRRAGRGHRCRARHKRVAAAKLRGPLLPLRLHGLLRPRRRLSLIVHTNANIDLHRGVRETEV